jgi:Na+/H+ antiporter NhaC
MNIMSINMEKRVDANQSNMAITSTMSMMDTFIVFTAIIMMSAKASKGIRRTRRNKGLGPYLPKQPFHDTYALCGHSGHFSYF